MPLDRRSLLATMPGAGAAGLFAGGAAPSPPAHTAGAWSAVTYLPLIAQRQLVANRKAVAGKPYERFFDPAVIVPTVAARALQSGPLTADQVLPPSVAGINRLLDPRYTTPDHGYAVLEGSTVYVQSRNFLPGATAAMVAWWFTWHPIESERYMLWFPQAHIQNSVADPARLANTRRSYGERLYGNDNYVHELIGPVPVDIIIRFTDPVKLGLDGGALRRGGFTASASAVVGPRQAPEVINSLMLHLARDVPGGVELINRYWVGPHPDLLRFAGAEKAAGMYAKMGWNDQLAEAMGYEFSVHDMTEFNHLATILPPLFRAFGNG